MLSLATLKTPGVYIDEVPKFPPSIAAVETAIPAFIGYTAKSTRIANNDLKNVPFRIESMAEFELYFGGSPKPTVKDVKIDLSYQFVSATLESERFLYDSLRLFYANGGGVCYIVSVGSYKEDPNELHFITAITALEKFDEPTMLLFPDAALIPANGLYNVQIATLKHCNSMMNRVGVFDLKKDDYKGTEFRNKIGISNLKYGTAYTPWLLAAFSKDINYGDMKGKIHRLGIPLISLKELTDNLEIKQLVGQLDDITDDSAAIKSATQLLSLSGILSEIYLEKFKLIIELPANNTNLNLQNLFKYLYNIAVTIDKYVGTLKYIELEDSVKETIKSLKEVYKDLINLEEEVKSIVGYTAQKPSGANIPVSGEWDTTFSAAAVATAILQGATPEEKRLSVLTKLDNLFNIINLAYQTGIIGKEIELEKQKNEALLAAMPAFKAIVNGINSTAMALPPSGAIAGIYAYTDNNRGVWKAPANVSIGGVEPNTIFSASELEGLNVDVMAGKSINAIRPFQGKGTLVYGARTLAGNDPEWRYVSVRRFFNMVEDSCKKATEQFVFEPNDANTWVRVQSMIDNFLWTLWRDGALQGATPQKAYYVSVGLGKTMTKEDIMDGRMIVEIGMAAVRPAEFIVLRFSHKLPEA
jgi:uncharacterized protein